MTRVLVVEDEKQIADLVREILEEEQYHVRVAWNGREALQMLVTFPADLIISDVMMPEMSGIELCRALTAHPTYHTIPVILTSAGAQPVSSPECRFVAFLQKPFRLPELLAAVARYGAESSP